MSKLPILEKNSYLSIYVKDNGLSAQLGYTDYNANRSYILSDYTDLTPLRRRLDDEFFTKNFWYEYLDNLEKVFNWDIVDRDISEIFRFRKFKQEGDGINGIRVVVDDNQPYFNQMFSSLRSFSQDISLRISEDNSINSLVSQMADRLGYKDLVLIDMDLKNFSIYRSSRNDTKGQIQDRVFKKAKINWGNEYGVIDSLNDSRIKAFLSAEISKEELLNIWSNFVLNRRLYVDDPNLLDVLRSYTTIQLYSILQSNPDILTNFGMQEGDSAVIVTGNIPNILGKKQTLLSMVDGLELVGTLDCYWSLDNKIYNYGKSYIDSPNTTDIILSKSDIFSSVTKVIIPEVRGGKKSKIIMSGYTDSLDVGKNEIYILSPHFTYLNLPNSNEKTIFEADLKEGTKIPGVKKNHISFVSSNSGILYDSVLVDGRPRPIVYGPDVYSNRTKLQTWLNDN